MKTTPSDILGFLRQVFRATNVKGFDSSQYQTVQVFYPSKDGTKIPMFIVHKKVNNMFICFIIICHRDFSLYKCMLLFVVITALSFIYT